MLKKKFLLIFCFIFLFLSCVSTDDMIKNSLVTDTSVAFGDKLVKLGYPVVQISQPEIIFDGEEWLNRATELIAQAKESVIMSFFLASECKENSVIYRTIKEKAKSGVPVYLIVDGVWEGDQTESKNHMAPIFNLRSYGVHLLIFNPFSLTKIIDPVSMTHREHRKYLIIDSETIALGGMNLNYMSTISSTVGQRDSMFIFNSNKLALLITKDFIDFWTENSYEQIDILSNLLSNKLVELDSAESNYVDNDTELKTDNEIINAYFVNHLFSDIQAPKLFGSLFYSAKEEIDILPLLPLANSNMLKMVKDASDRGVDIKLVLPNDPRKNMYKAGHFMVQDLQKAGMNVYSEKDLPETKALLHEKLIIVDNRYVIIGSVNFNYRSMALSNEIALVIDDVKFASVMKEHFNNILTKTDLITEEQAKDWKGFSSWINYLIMMIGG